MMLKFLKPNVCALLWATLLVTPFAWAAPAPEKLADYAHVAGIQTTGSTTGNHSHYHLSLPFAVYAGSKTPGLADLRVFNAAGETVPHVLVMPRRLSDMAQRTESISWFPLSDSRPESIYDDVVIERKTDGSVISIKAGQMKSGAPVEGLLLDLRAIDWPLASLKIETQGGQPMQHFSVHGSDDLKNWHLILDNGVLTRLAHNGQQLVQDEVKLPSVKSHYLKITWAKQEKVPEVMNIQGTFRQSQQGEMPFLWSEAIDPQPGKEGALNYAWQTPLPVEQVDILLSEMNTLAEVKLVSLAPPSPTSTEKPQRLGLETGKRLLNPQEARVMQPDTLARALIYRLTDNGKEARSTQIALSGRAIEGFSLLTDNAATGLGKAPPAVRIGFVPKQLVFLARGEAPFTLAWGKTDAPASTLSLNVLAPQHNDPNTLPGGGASLEAIKSAIATLPLPKEAPPEKSDYRWLLWGVLVAGVLLLLGMAWKLMKS